ncbi:EboA domain-containing protein [Streptomyces sp. NPDC054863]
MTTVPADSPTVLREALEVHLGGAARAWLHEALAEAAAAAARRTRGTEGPPAPSRRRNAYRANLPTWETRFAEAGRHCRTSGPLTEAAPTSNDPAGPATAARILLLCAARADRSTTHRLYTHGTAAERRAVLLALPYLGHARDGSALPLVEDALRTHDTRLVAAALGPYAAHHLDPHAWRHAVLKCLFTGVPVDTVHALARRARGDGELAHMLTDYAAERTAAGRPVPADLHRVLALTAQAPAPQAAAPVAEAPSEES